MHAHYIKGEITVPDNLRVLHIGVVYQVSCIPVYRIAATSLFMPVFMYFS